MLSALSSKLLALRSMLSARRGFIPHFAQSEGFTLIEMLIVIGITSILAGMVLTYTASSRNQVALYVEEAKLAQTISRAKSLTITTFNQQNPPCGYGVKFDYAAEQYGIFPYAASDCSSANLDPRTLNINYIDSSVQNLPLNVRMVNEGKGDEAEYVIFLAPEPRTWIWKVGYLATSTSGRIYLQTPAPPAPPSATLVIGLSSAGQITF